MDPVEGGIAQRSDARADSERPQAQAHPLRPAALSPVGPIAQPDTGGGAIRRAMRSER